MHAYLISPRNGRIFHANFSFPKREVRPLCGELQDRGRAKGYGHVDRVVNCPPILLLGWDALREPKASGSIGNSSSSLGLAWPRLKARVCGEGQLRRSQAASLLLGSVQPKAAATAAAAWAFLCLTSPLQLPQLRTKPMRARTLALAASGAHHTDPPLTSELPL